MDNVQKHQDFFQTFYASDHGRRVLCDLVRYVHGISGHDKTGIEVTTPEIAVGKCMLDDFLRYIKECCGVMNDFDLIEAEALIAARFTPQPQQEPKPLLYEEK